MPRGWTEGGLFRLWERMTHGVAPAFALASFTAKCTQLGRLDSKNSPFVSTLARRRDGILSLPKLFWFKTLTSIWPNRGNERVIKNERNTWIPAHL